MKTDTIPTTESLDRRRFIATSCLGLAAGVAANEGGAVPRDPVALAYERCVAVEHEFQRLAELPGGGNFDTLNMLRLHAESSDLETFIATTQPTTIEGACAKIRWVSHV